MISRAKTRRPSRDDHTRTWEGPSRSIVRVTSTTATAAAAAAAADLAALVLESDRRELAFLGVAHRRVARLVLLGVLATRLSAWAENQQWGTWQNMGGDGGN